MTSNIKLLLVYVVTLLFLLINLLNHSALLAYENSSESLKHLKVAKAYVDQNLYGKAEGELKLALKNDPKSPDILNNLGAVYLRLAQNHREQDKRNACLEKAREYFTQALDSDSNFPSAWNGLADAYYLSGHSQQAITYYKKALSLSPKHAYESQTNLANAQRDLGLFSEAQDNYKTAIELNPLYAPAHNGYAELLIDKHNLSAAYDEILEAIRLRPNYAIAYYHLGLIESARDHKNQALKAYLLSLRYETNSTYAQETQALINKLRLDSNNVSFEELQRFQAELSQPLAAPDSPPEGKESIANFDAKKHNLANKSNIAIGQTGITSIEPLIASKQWVKASKEIARLLRIHPNEPVLLNELGLILLNQKKYLNAEKVLIEAIKNSQNTLSAAYYNLGQVYLAQHDLPKAQVNLERAKLLAIKHSENSALIDNSLAIVLKKENKLDASLSAYHEAITNGGNEFPAIHYNLALLLKQMDKKKEAEEEFSNYLRLSPHGLNVASAKNYLKKLSQ